jgi:hypothetical protein
VSDLEIKNLKIKNEELLHDLAESCREIVEYSYAYSQLQKNNSILKKAFVEFLISKSLTDTEENANKIIDKLTYDLLNPKTQLLSF